MVKCVGSGIALTAPDTITVTPGTYMLIFSGVAEGTAGCAALGAAIEINGTPIATASCHFYAGNDPSPLMLQHMFTAVVPAKVTVRNNAAASLKYSDITLSLLKLC